MPKSSWAEKKARQAEFAMNKELDEGYGKIDFEANANKDSRDAAMGKGEDELFEKKLTKEEKKALAAAKREAKKKAKAAKGGGGGKGSKAKGGKNNKTEEKEEEQKAENALDLAKNALDSNASEDAKREAALEQLSQDQILVTSFELTC